MTRRELNPTRYLSATHRPLWAAILGTLLVVGCGDDPLGIESIDDPEVQLFVTAMNEHRTAVGCPALEWNGDVARVALAHSVDMVERNFFDHTNPDGESPFVRLHEAGISYSAAAENIAYGYGSAQAVLDSWLGSPGHRANIENCRLTEHGVGLEGTHWTHLFIRP